MTASQLIKKIIIVLLPVLLIGIFGQALWHYNISCADREENIGTANIIMPQCLTKYSD